MKQNILRVAVAISVVLFVAIVAIWVRSQWTFTRIGYRYSTGPSDQFKQRRVIFLTWRGAAEVMVSTERFRPDDDAARIGLCRDLPHAPHIEVYQQQGLSIDESDAANHWSFWYRSPEDSRRLWLQYSVMKPVGDSESIVLFE